jgi:hypothetical protein
MLTGVVSDLHTKGLTGLGKLDRLVFDLHGFHHLFKISGVPLDPNPISNL